jgi:hypothetical protein
MGRPLYGLSLSEAPPMGGAGRLVIDKLALRPRVVPDDRDDMSIATRTPRPDGPGLRGIKRPKNVRRAHGPAR